MVPRSPTAPTDAPVVSPLEIQRELSCLAREYVSIAERHLGDGLRAAVLFGSVARGEAGPGSDVDLLMVARGLPAGRLARGRAIDSIEEALEPRLAALRARGLFIEVNALWRTPQEAARITPLYLDLTEDAVILVDRDHLIATTLDRLRGRMRVLGSRRERIGSARVWHLAPNLGPGEDFNL